MEDQNSSRAEGQFVSPPPQAPRPPGGKVIQPTEAILQEQKSIQNNATPSAVPQALPSPEPTSQSHPQASTIYPEAARGINANPEVPVAHNEPRQEETLEPSANNSVINLLIVACASSLLFTFLIWLLVKLGHPTLNYSSTKFLGFLPYYLNIGALLLLSAVELLAAYLTQKLLFQRWTKALLITLPGIALVGSIYVNYITLAFTLFSFLLHLPSWFNTYPWIFIMTAILLYISYNLALLILRLSNSWRFVGPACCFLLAAMFISLIYMVNRAEVKHTVKGIVKALQSTRDNTTSTSLNGLNFKVYEPTYAAPGYVLQTSQNDPLSDGPSLYSADRGSSANFKFDFNDSKDNLSYSVIYYHASTQFQPPQDCGSDVRGIRVRQCLLVGHSSSGCDLYYKNYGGYDEYFCKIANTMINIEDDGDLTNSSDGSAQADYSIVIKIYNSLQLLSTQQLTSKYSATSR